MTGVHKSGLPAPAVLLKTISMGFVACGLIFKDSRGLGVKGSSEKPKKIISNDEQAIVHRLLVKWRIG